MGSEYFINSQELENKVRDLLPSQGGAGSGFDLSASTQIIPIIDLTESAEGSNIRQDLQTSLSHGSVTSFDVIGATSTIIVNTGYFRIFGTMTSQSTTDTSGVNISISDGTTSKILLEGRVTKAQTNAGFTPVIPFDFNVLVTAGDSVIVTSGYSNVRIAGCTRQIASIDAVSYTHLTLPTKRIV